MKNEETGWVIPEPQPVNVTNQIVQQIDVSSIIAKLDEEVICCDEQIRYSDEPC